MSNQKKYWDSVANEKEFTVPFNVEKFGNYIKKDAIILDIGCGYGRTLNQLKQNGYTNLIGIDFSKQMIARGNLLYPDIKMEIMKNENKLPNDHHDVVILFAVLTCIESNSEQNRLFLQIRKSLKQNGIIYINDFLLNTDSRNINRYKQFESEYQNYGTFELENGGVVRHHDKKRIKQLLQNFITLEYEENQFKTMNGNISNGFSYLGRKK